ncbi:MAG: SMI1/KNR4 family protein [Eubacteriales bacterium]|nr:SMI1/KNR4 family protein [Eubacteriales bacterium]
MSQQIVDNLSKLTNFSFTGAASEESINNAQQELNLKFSTDYREIASKYGAISYTGHNLTGISPYPGNNVVIVTKEQRTINPNIPESFYVIEEAHLDSIVVWQSATGEIYQTEYDGKPHLIYKSLAEYIEAV